MNCNNFILLLKIVVNLREPMTISQVQPVLIQCITINYFQMVCLILRNYLSLHLPIENHEFFSHSSENRELI